MIKHIFSVFILLTAVGKITLTAQEKRSRFPVYDRLGDYYFEGNWALSSNFNSLEIHNPDIRVETNKTQPNVTGYARVGWHTIDAQYVTWDLGIIRISEDFKTPIYPQANQMLHGGETRIFWYTRIAYENYFPLGRKMYFVPNLGLAAYFTEGNTQGHHFNTPLHIETVYRYKTVLASSLNLGLNYHLHSRHFITVNLNASYVINSKNFNTNIYSYQFPGGIDKLDGFEITTSPFFTHISIGYKISLEGRYFFKKRQLINENKN